MLKFLAMILASIAAYLPHLLFGDHLSMFADFTLGTVVGGVVYVIAIYKLRRLRGDF